ncbi:MAG: hypothetical protein ABSH20_30195, partial [Tepidisphaeraceae bacterium]
MIGERPGLLLGDDRILMHVHSSPDGEDTTLACFDFEGRQLWSQPNLVGWLSLPDKRFIVSTAAGTPLVIDCNGLVIWRGPETKIDQVTRHDELLFFAGERQVWSTDLKFGSPQIMTWPGPGRPSLKCFVDGAFYWA